MGHHTQAQEVANTEVMVNGIKANQDVPAQRKSDIAFANALQADVDACITLNNEQETLKEKLKEKTEQAEKKPSCCAEKKEKTCCKEKGKETKSCPKEAGAETKSCGKKK